MKTLTTYRVTVSTPEGGLVAEETIQVERWITAAFLAARMNRHRPLLEDRTHAVCTVYDTATNELAGMCSVAVHCIKNYK
jgi:hypothetical protein